MLSLSPATIAALRADYTDVSPTRESPDPRLVALFEDHARVTAELTELRALQAEQQRAFAEGLQVATAPLEPLRGAARELLRDLNESLDGCLICGDEDGHTDDCTAAALAAALRLPPKPSPRRVPGRPAGQRIAEEPTAEARELLGLDVTPDRAALLSLYHDDATELLDHALKAQHEPEGLHGAHVAIVEALADAHTDGRGEDVATTVPDETIEARKDGHFPYSTRVALDRAGAPTVSPEGAPVSDGWRAKWAANELIQTTEELARLRASMDVFRG